MIGTKNFSGKTAVGAKAWEPESMGCGGAGGGIEPLCDRLEQRECEEMV